MFRRLCYKQLCRLSQLDFINEHFQIECESFRTFIRERGDSKFGIYSEFLFQPSTTESKLIESNQNKCMVYYFLFLSYQNHSYVVGKLSIFLCMFSHLETFVGVIVVLKDNLY